MNTYRLESLLEQYNPENDLGPITYTDAALLEVVIDLAERVRELEATAAQKPAQPESATDRPASKQPKKHIELTYRALSASSVNVCMDCITYADPPETIAGCWAHLEKMRERGEIPQAQYDEIRRMADFIEAD